MPRSPRFDLGTLALDESSPEPLYRQLQEELRRAILEGRLKPGERLPSTRQLAQELGISRNTTSGAYLQLTAEGYIESILGSGTRVSRQLPDRLLQACRPACSRASRGDGRPLHLSRRGRELEGLGHYLCNNPWNRVAPFQPHVAALDAFPLELWSQLTARRYRRMPRSMLALGDPCGYRPLREAIAAYVGSARGVRCEADQVVVTAGTQQAIELMSRLLLDPGDLAWIEEPGYLPGRMLFEQVGARVVSVPVDGQGLDVDAGIKSHPKARLAYITPSSQWPLAVTMSLPRRLALLEWAREADAWILEDDYNGEFRYAGRPLPALQGLDDSGRVIYMGTFSKILFPSMRLGFLVLPRELVPAFAASRWLADRHSPIIEQAVLADFIDEGHFGRHVRRMRTLYAERQEALLSAFSRHLGDVFELEPVEVGMHLVARLCEGRDEATILRAAKAAGIELHPASLYYATPPPRPTLILGFSAYGPAEIQKGALDLRRAIDAANRS
ncbi:PLP-dependent aminotransferase family protein [Singulisphaera sp. PoT]|uniref:MocR-like pyridoxine biosynthesis transcription factor PdxR n=1 Tax=Singulisphaera sp. PoT TaxID=3411797 RepID=UPI003BF46459